MTLKLKPENMNDITIQFRVFDNLFASACMQYATSALGRITDVAENISIQEKKKSNNEIHPINQTKLKINQINLLTSNMAFFRRTFNVIRSLHNRNIQILKTKQNNYENKKYK